LSGYTLRLRGTPEVDREYACDEHGPFTLTVDAATSSTPRPCPECGALSERTLEARYTVKVANSFQRGKRDEMPPWATTTEAIADGMPVEEWREKRATYWRDHDRAVMKQKGLMP
jgi:hypothetical protein